MPTVEYETEMSLSCEDIWEFVKDMNNWAPFLTGYQQHEIIDDTDSIWTLKGDVGILSRVVKLRAHITDWNGPEQVSFTLTGINEKVDGDGTLRMSDARPAAAGADGETAGEGAAAATETEPAAKPPKRKRVGLFRRFMTWMFRRWFKRKHGEGPKRALPAPSDESRPRSKLVFTLRMDAGGPTAPLVNAVLGPAMLPAAEDLANKIAAHLEQAHGLTAADAPAGNDAAA